MKHKENLTTFPKQNLIVMVQSRNDEILKLKNQVSAYQSILDKFKISLNSLLNYELENK